MKEIRRQIKERSFYKVYLLTGDENYLVMQARHLLKEALVADGDEMNYTLFEDTRIDMQHLKELALTYPFFSEKRLLMLDRTGILKSGKDALIDIMENMPETTCMVISEPEIDKRSKAYKWIKKKWICSRIPEKKPDRKSAVALGCHPPFQRKKTNSRERRPIFPGASGR